MLKFAQTYSYTWQKLLGVESIGYLCRNNKVLKCLYDRKLDIEDINNKNIYEEFINTINMITNSIIGLKAPFETNINLQDRKYHLDKSDIFTEEIPLPIFNQNNLIKILIDAYSNIIDNLTKCLNDYNANNKLLSTANLDHINNFNNEEFNSIKDFISFKYDNIKITMTALIEFTDDASILETFLNIYQKYIVIFGVTDTSNSVARDSYLTDICKLAVPSSISNITKMTEKNIKVSKFLFKIASCFQSLDTSSWIIIFDALQRIYFILLNSKLILNIKEEFDIDVLIRNLEENVKNSYPQNSKMVKSVLRSSKLIVKVQDQQITDNKDKDEEEHYHEQVNEGKVDPEGSEPEEINRKSVPDNEVVVNTVNPQEKLSKSSLLPTDKSETFNVDHDKDKDKDNKKQNEDKYLKLNEEEIIKLQPAVSVSEKPEVSGPTGISGLFSTISSR